MNNILKIFSGAFSFIYYYRNSLIKALIAPAAVIVLLTLVESVFEIPTFWTFLLMVVYFLTHTIFAITTHRIILLGEASVPEWGFRKISIREIWFLIYGIGLGLLLIAPALLVFVPIVGWGLAIASIAYLLGRLSLVFPAIATGEDWSFQNSWVATKDHQLMMVVTVVILPIIIVLPETLLAHIPYGEVPAAILSLFTTAFSVAALSLAFKLVGNENKVR